MIIFIIGCVCLEFKLLIFTNIFTGLNIAFAAAH